MFVTPGLIALALSISTFASPTPDGGTRIDVQRRNILTTQDGRFDLDAAKQQVAHDKRYAVHPHYLGRRGDPLTVTLLAANIAAT